MALGTMGCSVETGTADPTGPAVDMCEAIAHTRMLAGVWLRVLAPVGLRGSGVQAALNG